jgi:hypothetical protein
MDQHVRDVKAIDAGFTHMRGCRPSQIMRTELERHTAIAQHCGSLFRPIDDAGRPMIREDVSLVAVLGGRALENLQHARCEGNPVRVGVLGRRRRNQPPAADQIDVVPTHGAELAPDIAEIRCSTRFA